jgi:hypothetical protein
MAHVGLVATYVWIASSGGARPIPEPPPVFRGYHHPWHPIFDLQRWDAILYAGIAANGYASPASPHTPTHLINWFPGLPLLARGLHALTGWTYPLTLAALGAACTLAFWLVLWSRSSRTAFGSPTVAATAALVLLWPGSFFWFAGMTEPLVALLSLVIIVWWVEERYWCVAMLLAFSTAVKQVFTVVAVALAGLRWVRSRPHALRVALELIVACSGIVAFCAYCAHAFGDPLAWLHMGMRIFGGRTPHQPFDIGRFLRFATTTDGSVALGSVALVAAAAALLLPTVRREGLGVLTKGPLSPPGVDLLLWTLAASTTALFLAADAIVGTIASMPRYQTVNIPLLLLCGRALTRVPPLWRYLLLVVLFIATFWLGVRFTGAYWRWEWVA